MTTQVDLVDLFKFLWKENKLEEQLSQVIYYKNQELLLSFKVNETFIFFMLLF